MSRITLSEVKHYFEAVYNDEPVAIFSYTRGRKPCNYVAVFSEASRVEGTCIPRTHMLIRSYTPVYTRIFEDRVYPYFDECYRDIYSILQRSFTVKRIL